MTTINLYQNQPETGAQFKVKGVNSGLIFSIFLIMASIALVGILKASVSYLEKKDNAVQDEIGQAQKGLAGIGSLKWFLQDRTKKSKSQFAGGRREGSKS